MHCGKHEKKGAKSASIFCSIHGINVREIQSYKYFSIDKALQMTKNCPKVGKKSVWTAQSWQTSRRRFGSEISVYILKRSCVM